MLSHGWCGSAAAAFGWRRADRGRRNIGEGYSAASSGRHKREIRAVHLPGRAKAGCHQAAKALNVTWCGMATPPVLRHAGLYDHTATPRWREMT